MKTFEVYHLENWHGYNTDSYYNGELEATNMKEAINVFKSGWLDADQIDLNDISEDYQDEGLCFLTVGTDYFDENGNEINDNQIEELEKQHDKDMSLLIDEGIIGYCEHIYRISDPEFDPAASNSNEEIDE